MRILREFCFFHFYSNFQKNCSLAECTLLYVHDISRFRLRIRITRLNFKEYFFLPNINSISLKSIIPSKIFSFIRRYNYKIQRIYKTYKILHEVFICNRLSFVIMFIICIILIFKTFFNMFYILFIYFLFYYCCLNYQEENELIKLY